MKRILLIAIFVGVIAILAFAALSFPMRFRLSSSSPSGEAHAMGLRFQETNPHPLDGTLRLFVYHDQTVTKQQTTIPWGRDLKINWKECDDGESFVIEKDGSAMIEFQILGAKLKCLNGEEHLAADPYKPKPTESGPRDEELNG